METQQINLRGSYDEATFCARLAQGLGTETSLDSLEAALHRLGQKGAAPLALTWHDFHGAEVAGQSAAAMAARLRQAAHTNPNLRLVFFDEERGGQ